MAHELDIRNGRASMAYVGATPWHGLGQALSDSATFADWQDAAGFGFTIEKVPVTYTAPDGTTRVMPDRFVLCRSDDGAPISVMSDRYKIVQPEHVLGFFADVCEHQGWNMETAGVLKGGAQYWALARTGIDGAINGDEHRLYTLLATSADGSLATIAKATAIRVVCANTLAVAMHDSKGNTIRVKHNTAFDARKVQRELGMVALDDDWSTFREQMLALSNKPVSPSQST